MVPQPDTAQLRETLLSLKLDRMADNLEALCDQAAKEEWPYATFLGQLLEEELAARDQRRLSVTTKMARFPFHKTLEQFDFAFQPSVEKRRIQELASLRFVSSGSNVLFLGPPGVGKTHLAIGLGLKALQAGLSTYFLSVPDLMDQVSQDAQRGQLPKRMQQLCKPKVLILDEMGYLPLERPMATFLFQLVAKRYEKEAIILSSNKSFREWGELFTDQVLATALLDRLLHHSTILNIRGQSYRLKEKRQAGVFQRPEALEAASSASAYLMERSRERDMTSRTNDSSQGQNRGAQTQHLLSPLEQRRQDAVKRYLDGDPIERICREMGCSTSWLYKWKNRYQVAESDWSTARSRQPKTTPSKTPETVASEIVRLSQTLSPDTSGTVSARVIRDHLGQHGVGSIPSIRTIYRILNRHAKEVSSHSLTS